MKDGGWVEAFVATEVFTCLESPSYFLSITISLTVSLFG
jgi:hypothetical protein